MDDRHAGYLITLTENIREDEAEATFAALRMIRGVLSVEPVPAPDAISEVVISTRVGAAWRARIYRMLTEARESGS